MNDKDIKELADLLINNCNDQEGTKNCADDSCYECHAKAIIKDGWVKPSSDMKLVDEIHVNGKITSQFNLGYCKGFSDGSQAQLTADRAHETAALIKARQDTAREIFADFSNTFSMFIRKYAFSRFEELKAKYQEE